VRSLFAFPDSGGGAVSPVVLTYAGADAVTGSASVSDSAGVMTATVPSGSAHSALSDLPDFIVWDTGYTVADLRGRPYGLRASSVAGPVGSGAQIALVYGFAFATSTAVTRSSDESIWAEQNIGYSTDANTRSRCTVRRDNQTLAAGTILDSHTESRLIVFPESDDKVGSWIARFNAGTSVSNEAIGSNTTAMTSTLKVLAFFAFGLTGTEASAQDASVHLEFMPPGADWSDS